MKIIFSGAILILLIIVSIGLYRLEDDRLAELKKSEGLSARIDSLNEENGKLLADIEYFSNSENLMKEIKSLFNYKKPGEKLMIIVPEKP